MSGKSAELAMKGAVALLGLLIVAITLIVVQGREIPDVFSTLSGMLVGFLVGGRVVTPNAAIATERANGGTPA